MIQYDHISHLLVILIKWPLFVPAACFSSSGRWLVVEITMKTKSIEMNIISVHINEITIISGRKHWFHHILFFPFWPLWRRCRWTGGKLCRNPWSVSSFWRTERHQWSIWNSGMCWSHRLLDDLGTLHISAWCFLVIHFVSQDFFEDLSTPENVEVRKKEIKRAKGKQAMVFMVAGFIVCCAGCMHIAIARHMPLLCGINLCMDPWIQSTRSFS